MYRIEPYSDEYHEQYVALYIETWRDKPYLELFTKKAVADNALQNAEFLYLLIAGADQVIGFIGGRALTRDCEFYKNECEPPIDRNAAFYIDELGVDKAHRKAGFGQALMLFLMSVARHEGYSQFVLRTHASETNPAIALYKSLGFERRRTSDGTDHGVLTTQTRIDENIPDTDFRIYYYKTFRPRG